MKNNTFVHYHSSVETLSIQNRSYHIIASDISFHLMIYCMFSKFFSWGGGNFPYRKGVIQGHPLHRCPTTEALVQCSRIMFQVVLSLDVSVSSQPIFLCCMSVYVESLFLIYFVSIIRTGCNAKQTKSI